MTPTLKPLHSDLLRQEMTEAVSKYRDDSFVRLSLGREVKLTEDIVSQETTIECILQHESLGAKNLIPIKSSGHGPVNALCSAMIEVFKKDYTFTSKLNLIEFKIDTLRTRTRLRTDAPVSTTFIVAVESRSPLSFRSESTSIVEASMSSVLQMFELYINMSKTLDKVQRLMDDYAKRNRGDLYTKSMSDLARMISCTCYNS